MICAHGYTHGCPFCAAVPGTYLPHMVMAARRTRIPRVHPQPTTPRIRRDMKPDKRKLVVAATVDADGELRLIVSIDGKIVGEVATDGHTLRIEEDI